MGQCLSKVILLMGKVSVLHAGCFFDFESGEGGQEDVVVGEGDLSVFAFGCEMKFIP